MHVGVGGLPPLQTLHERAQLTSIQAGFLVHSPFAAQEGHSMFESLQVVGATVGGTFGSLGTLIAGVGLSVGGAISHLSQDLAQLANMYVGLFSHSPSLAQSKHFVTRQPIPSTSSAHASFLSTHV